MAIEFSYDGTTISVEGGALEISKDSSGLKLKFNRTPSSAWSTAGKTIGSNFGVAVDSADKFIKQGSYALADTKPSWLLPGKAELKDTDYDPHRYAAYYSNGYTVKSSVERAMTELRNKLWYKLPYHYFEGGHKLLKEVVRAMIVNGAGRDAVYRLAGRVKAEYENGTIAFSDKRRPVDILNMYAYTEGYLNAPLKQHGPT